MSAMDVFVHATTQMLVLFLLLVVGFIARRAKLMNDSFDTMLSQLVMNIALPAMIVNAQLSSEEMAEPQAIWQILACSAAAYVLICIVAFLVPRLFPRLSASSRGAHSFVIAFGNVGFMGLPVLDAIFGSTAVLYGAIYNIPFNLAVFTAGVAFVSRKEKGEGQKRAPLRERAAKTARSLVSPATIACVLVVVLALLQVSDRGGIVQMTCSYLGQLTVPASMLIIGSSLAMQPLRSTLCHLTPYISAALRLLGIPLLVNLVFRFFIADPLMLGVLTVSSGMPVAAIGVMFTLAYKGDRETMMRGTFISTVASVLTIPLLAVFVS